MILITKDEAKHLSINNLKRYRLRKMMLRYLYEERFVSASEVSQKISVSLPTTKTLLDELIALATPGVDANLPYLALLPGHFM